jgi:hypothetical protein
LGDLEKHTKYELESAHRFLEGFKGKTIEEFGYQIGHVQNEMDNRFEHQN